VHSVNNDINKDDRKTELKKAQHKIAELEKRLLNLEETLNQRTPKNPFNEVKFLNYRKLHTF
jgi:hypothetical protein